MTEEQEIKLLEAVKALGEIVVAILTRIERIEKKIGYEFPKN